MKKPSKKEILLKSATYRCFVIMYELFLASLFGLVGLSVVDFVVANNLLKFLGYLIFEVWWFGWIRTRFNVLGKLLKKMFKINDGC